MRYQSRYNRAYNLSTFRTIIVNRYRDRDNEYDALAQFAEEGRREAGCIITIADMRQKDEAIKRYIEDIESAMLLNSISNDEVRTTTLFKD